MSAINDLISQIQDESLRDRIQNEVNKMTKQKKFGLVFEEHLPECTPLYDVPVKRGSLVVLKGGDINNKYIVGSIVNGIAKCMNKVTEEVEEIPLENLVTVAEFGEPIYPYLKPIDSICNAPDSDLWHTLIEADNYHALQLLEYLYAGKVDCIYIDPPYNTGAKDWKYNNDYVDGNDQYRHSKWLSMMQKRLKIAKKLLNPKDSVLIVTIDEKEYLHLGCLLEEMFPEARMQMISSVISNNGNARALQFSRTNEFIFFVMFGDCGPEKLPLDSQWLGNLKVESSKATEGFQWGRMLRGGNSGRRAYSPGCFYPVYIDSDGVFKGLGDPLPLEKDWKGEIAPNGWIAVWPIHLDGSEGCWSCQPSLFKKLYEQGYIKFGDNVTERGVRITYIQTGMRERIEKGEIKVIGREPKNGTVILETDASDAKYIPGTQWAISTHDATYFGTKYIANIIGRQKFTFPKSIYAVYDTIRFFVTSKPNALIVDFFAGSGTTLHAVNLINESDNGHRRCIMVTNNEVSEAEAKELKDKGLHPGDDEWERLGIARYVTWPRTVCTIEGHDMNGNPLRGNYGAERDEYVPDDARGMYKKKKAQMYPELAEINCSDGFKTNAAFLKLGFLDKTSVALGRQFKEMLPTLWMKAGAHGPCPEIGENDDPDMLILSDNKMAILVEECSFPKFEAEVLKHPEIKTVFIVTDSESGYREMIKGFDGIETFQLYRDYLDNFRINTGRN